MTLTGVPLTDPAPIDRTPIAATALLDPEVIEDPYPFYRRLVTQAPVWRVPGTPVVVVSSYDHVSDALGRTGDFSSHMKCLLYKNDAGLPEQLSFGDLGQQTLATADPPEHSLHRKTVFPELVAKRMIALEPLIRDLARARVGELVDNDGGDFMTLVGNLIPITVMNDVVGFGETDLTRLLEAAFDSTAMLGSVLTLSALNALIERIGEVQDWIGTQLDATCEVEDDGRLLGTIRRGVAAGTFGRYEASVMLHTLLSAGGETTSSLLGNAVRILAEQTPLQDELRSNLSLVPAFIEEVLRLESPFRMMLRSVPAPTSLGGTEVNPGDTVVLLFAAANRDPSQFERPDEIDLARELPRGHFAFGKGIHYCVGARLARLEAEIVLTELLARTTMIELEADDPPRQVPSLLVRRLSRLPVRLTSLHD